MTINKLICFFKGCIPTDCFVGTEFEGVNVYCSRCYRPIGDDNWIDRYSKIQGILDRKPV